MTRQQNTIGMAFAGGPMVAQDCMLAGKELTFDTDFQFDFIVC